MENHGDNRVALSSDVERLMRATRPQVPACFAMKTRMRFEKALAAKRLRQLMGVSVGLFLFTSLTLWAVLFDVLGLSQLIWKGVQGAGAMIRSLMSLWGHLPMVGVAFAMTVMMIMLLLGAAVVRLDKVAWSSK